MLTAAALALMMLDIKKVDLTPTADIWVYPHASDPEHDAYLRVWGAEGREVPADANELQDFSISLMKWDASKIPAGKITKAELILTQVASPGYELAYAKQHPLTARAVRADFNEKNWTYDKASEYLPEAKETAVFGTGAPASLGDGKEFTITLDLLKGKDDFNLYVEQARNSSDHNLAIALTAGLDVEEFGQQSIYKFFSKDVDTAGKRPILRMTIQNDSRSKR
jgi:hypothetical protein